jgi:hypothetical protein
MNTSLYAVLVCLTPTSALAHGFDRPAPPLETLLAQSQTAGKPVLLDFSAVW